MGRHFFSSLRVRLVALVLLAVIPAFGIILNSATARRQEARVRAREDTLDLVRLVSSESEHLIDSARSLLTLLARLPEVQGTDPAACSARLSDLLKHYPRFVNFGVIDPDGRVTASAVPTDEPANLSDRPFFQMALRSDGFQLGHYHVGRITGKPSFNFVLPVRDETGALKSVLFAAQEVTSLQSFLSRLNPPDGASVVVADGSFTVLACHPGGPPAPGQRLPEPLVIILQTGLQWDVREMAGEGGSQVLAGFVTLGGGAGSGALQVLVTLSEDVAFAPVRTAVTQDLLLLGLAFLFVVT